MALTDFFQPQELSIIGYAERKDAEKNFHYDKTDEVFTAPVSLDSYTQNYQQHFQKTRGIGTSAQTQKYMGSAPQRLQFKIVLDATNAMNSGFPIGPLKAAQDIHSQVDQFKNVCYEFKSDKHQPRVLQIEWGKLNVICRLRSFEVKFSLFDKSGEPLRAELDTHFLEDISAKKIIEEENRESPDITHIHQVKAGDNLWMLAKNVYGSNNYYLQLAAFNNLDHFRALRPGDEIQIPPLEVLENK